MQNKFIGSGIYKFSSLDSTNSKLAELVLQGKVNSGDAVICDVQNAGRGQRGNSWISEPFKNLTFSFYLHHANFEVADQFYLNMILSCGILDYLKKLGSMDVKIKWPNDILLNGRKVCGILCENSISGQRISSSIIGIGLNVNQTNFSEDAGSATSIALAYNQLYNLEEEFYGLVESINQSFLNYYQQDYAALKRKYLQNLWGFNEFIQFENDIRKFTAKIADVAKDGRLFLEDENGEISSYLHKEIRFLY